jgi:hypothetical protein
MFDGLEGKKEEVEPAGRCVEHGDEGEVTDEIGFRWRREVAEEGGEELEGREGEEEAVGVLVVGSEDDIAGRLDVEVGVEKELHALRVEEGSS